MEGGQLKLVLLAHMALEGIYLCGLWPGMSPELYGLIRHIIFRHGITQLRVKMNRIVGEAEEVLMMIWRKTEDGIVSGEQTAKVERGFKTNITFEWQRMCFYCPPDCTRGFPVLGICIRILPRNVLRHEGVGVA